MKEEMRKIRNRDDQTQRKLADRTVIDRRDTSRVCLYEFIDDFKRSWAFSFVYFVITIC